VQYLVSRYTHKATKATAAGQSNRGNSSRAHHTNIGTRNSELSKSRRLCSKASHVGLLCSHTREQQCSAKAAVPSHHRARDAAPSCACRPGRGLAICAATPSTRKAARVHHHLLDWSSPSSTLPQVTSHLAPPAQACRCPGSLSTASMPVGFCPTGPPSRHVYSPSRIPPAELPQPPLTGKHELCVLDPGQNTAFPRL
jgi:hypothetical protein